MVDVRSVRPDGRRTTRRSATGAARDCAFGRSGARPSARIRRAGPWLVALALLAAVSACSSLAPDADAAAHVAQDFHRALTDGNGAAACELLAPQTVETVERDSGGSCADAILDQDVPDGGPVVGRQAFGQLAQIVMTGDVVFLGAFGDRWRVTAAGCTSRVNRPYHCSIEGG